MHGAFGDLFISLDLPTAFQVVLLGFIGGTLSGFIGSGGAFFMTPGMMNLGVQGVVAVGSNITHKFGKAMVGSRRHGENAYENQADVEVCSCAFSSAALLSLGSYSSSSSSL